MSKPSKLNKAPTFTTTRHAEIAKAGKKLIADPESTDRFVDLVSALTTVASSRTEPRRNGQQVSLAKRVGALVHTYCPGLPSELAVRVRARAKELLAPTMEQVKSARHAVNVPERVAALTLGVSVENLKEMCTNRETRRALGWPRPIGDGLLFHSAGLDAQRAGKFFAELPAEEPWPASSWPMGWRS